MSVVRPLASGAVAALGALIVAPIAGPGESAARIIDRTLICETGQSGAVHQVGLWTNSAIRGESASARGAVAEIRTNLQPTWRLAWVGETSVELSPACKPTKTRVRLTGRGLSGGDAASIYEDQYDCWTPRNVLIRLRAVFRSPVTLRRGSPYGFPILFARGKVREGYLAIQTKSGKRILFSKVVAATGKAHAFTSDDCFPD